MDVQAAILAAVAARPADDTPRLAYADWLDDHAGDLPDPPAARARAEFIRVQCEAKRLEHLPTALLQGYADLYRRQDFLLTHHRRDLLGPLADALGPHDAVFDRGFVTELGLDAAAFVRHADAIAALAPPPDVTVTVPNPTAEFLGSPHLGRITAVNWQAFAPLPDADYPLRPRWDRLRVLNVSGCEVDDFRLGVLANSGDADYPALTDLDVSFNAVSDEGVRLLVASPLWPRLRVLVIGSNPISDEGAKLLADAPPTDLQYLNVARTGITSDGRKWLLGRLGASARLDDSRPRADNSHLTPAPPQDASWPATGPTTTHKTCSRAGTRRSPTGSSRRPWTASRGPSGSAPRCPPATATGLMRTSSSATASGR